MTVVIGACACAGLRQLRENPLFARHSDPPATSGAVTAAGGVLSIRIVCDWLPTLSAGSTASTDSVCCPSETRVVSSESWAAPLGHGARSVQLQLRTRCSRTLPSTSKRSILIPTLSLALTLNERVPRRQPDSRSPPVTATVGELPSWTLTTMFCAKTAPLRGSWFEHVAENEHLTRRMSCVEPKGFVDSVKDRGHSAPGQTARTEPVSVNTLDSQPALPLTTPSIRTLPRIAPAGHRTSSDPRPPVAY